MEEKHRARAGWGSTEHLCPLWACHFPSTSMCSPVWKLSEFPFPRGFFFSINTLSFKNFTEI